MGYNVIGVYRWILTSLGLTDRGESSYPQMQTITVTVPVVETLLLNLKPYKAAGPDAILPRTLNYFATEIAHVLTFTVIPVQQSQATGALPM